MTQHGNSCVLRQEVVFANSGRAGVQKTVIFNNLLQPRTEYADIHTRADSDLPPEFQGSPFFPITC